ncbi:zinc finger protein SHOOT GRAVITROPISM 5-like [Heracleum sosnowskyi]|uniref:Zinc finger protein SHOOT GRAVITROPISM 5-like n=1 Tax=Heracleum sosnowskyi TaxID=360622 RepID=A0AAD8MU93_9APIA|nr:zinc finger protein SHOOT GRAVITROPISM 5-like [Heracleum sosnowskyi]
MLNYNPTAVSTCPSPSDHATFTNCSQNPPRKRRPAGTPDPDAEVVSLSPKTLLESDRYVCEICNQGFQRDQNLQMHRRRHKVPWKLLKRESPHVVRKRVFVCPEPSCLHHDPCHALGDLVGIKKHFRRKHSDNKQWVCDKCSKGYAVQSDYKAHLKTCGTRGHSCDCGRVFSRVESFIEHQDVCNIRRIRPDHQRQQVTLQQQQACSPRTPSSTSPSSDTNFTNFASLSRSFSMPITNTNPTSDHLRSEHENLDRPSTNHDDEHQHYLEQKLLPSTSNVQECSFYSNRSENISMHLGLSIGTSSSCSTRDNENRRNDEVGGNEELKKAMAEKALAEEARKQGKRQIELAEMEFGNAKRIRQAAQAELEKARIVKEQATKKIKSLMWEITCHACKQQIQAAKLRNNGTAAKFFADDQTSLAMSYMSSADRRI